MTEPPVSGSASPAGLQRAVRFGAFLIAAVLALGYGLTEVATALVELLECNSDRLFCGSLDSPVNSSEYVPPATAGAILVAVSFLLFYFAYKSR